MKLKRLLIFILILFFLALLSIFYPSIQSLISGKSISSTNIDYPKEKAFVNRVIDGDTIVVTGPEIGNNTHIRLLGENTPEHDQPYFNEARELLVDEIENKTVELQRDSEDTDKYKRKLRYVFYNDNIVNIQPIEEGFATTFMLDGLRYENKFKIAEKLAKDNNLALWKRSEETCADCIELEKLDQKSEFFILKNSCNFDCKLDNWFVKDDANHFFYLKDMQANQEIQYDSNTAKDSYGKSIKTGVWNDDHDRLFMRDENGNLVLFYEY